MPSFQCIRGSELSEKRQLSEGPMYTLYTANYRMSSVVIKKPKFGFTKARWHLSDMVITKINIKSCFYFFYLSFKKDYDVTFAYLLNLYRFVACIYFSKQTILCFSCFLGRRNFLLMPKICCSLIQKTLFAFMGSAWIRLTHTSSLQSICNWEA